VQILNLQEHHALLALGLGAQLLHLYVDLTVDLLEHDDVRGIEIRSLLLLWEVLEFHMGYLNRRLLLFRRMRFVLSWRKAFVGGRVYLWHG
jgi:hypothetical protein